MWGIGARRATCFIPVSLEWIFLMLKIDYYKHRNNYNCPLVLRMLCRRTSPWFNASFAIKVGRPGSLCWLWIREWGLAALWMVTGSKWILLRERVRYATESKKWVFVVWIQGRRCLRRKCRKSRALNESRCGKECNAQRRGSPHLMYKNLLDIESRYAIKDWKCLWFGSEGLVGSRVLSGQRLRGELRWTKIEAEGKRGTNVWRRCYH